VASWSDSVQRYRANPGLRVVVQCPSNGSPHPVWGSDVYTDDSAVCTAGLHAGRITREQGGRFVIRIVPGQPAYLATRRNGVSTLAYAAYPGSFVIEGGPLPGLTTEALNRGAGVHESPPPPPPPPPDAPRVLTLNGRSTLVPAPGSNVWSLTATGLRGQIGHAFVLVCPARGSAASIWGSDVYTDDSALCTAAVHAGAITLVRGGVFSVRVEAGRGRYDASVRNGVTSRDYASFAGSIRVLR
jgi:hypothetical protein